MALPDLATVADLSDRGVDIPDSLVADVMLAVASSIVRGAAQSPIAETTSTVELWATDAGNHYLDLPGKPVTEVDTVVHDGDTLLAADYELILGRLWAASPWAHCQPVKVVVTLTHGFAEVPPHIVQLVVDLAIAGMNAATEGAHDPRVVAEKIDDYSVTFSQSASAVATAMELPAATRLAIRKQFGGGVAMLVQA